MSSKQQRRVRERRSRQGSESRRGAPPRGRTPARGGGGGLGKWTIGLGIAVVALVVGGIAFAATHQSSNSPTATIGPEDLAPVVDGVHCNAGESLVYHIHQHLALYDHGRQVTLPNSIGIPGSESNPTCLYWIHVHALDPGIIHVESPRAKSYTLGNFFDIWKATKNSTVPPGDSFVQKLEAADAKGQVTVFVNGKRWTRDYRVVPLQSQKVITVEIGKPVVPPKPFTNWGQL